VRIAVLTASALTAGAIGLSVAPAAWADPDIASLGSQAELVNGDVVQGWTVSNLKPSSDVIPYPVAGTLWEATATDTAIQGGVTPIISNFNARARSGETYRVLFGVATPQGVNPSTLAQGQQTSGKVYFDVTGDTPDSVVYNAGGQDLVVWVQPPPSSSTSSGGSGYSSTTPRGTGSAETTATPGTPAEPAAAGSTAAPVPAGSAGTPLPAGSAGTPLPAGSAGTPVPAATPGQPVPAGSAGTPAPAGAEAVPAPAGSAGTPAAPQAPASTGTPVEGAMATPMPAGSAGTPVSEGTAPAAGQGTPAPATPAVPTTTMVPTPAG